MVYYPGFFALMREGKRLYQYLARWHEQAPAIRRVSFGREKDYSVHALKMAMRRRRRERRKRAHRRNIGNQFQFLA